MRIVIPELTNDTKVFDDEGNDITAKLAIRQITITVGPDRVTTAVLECYADQIELEIADGKWIDSRSTVKLAASLAPTKLIMHDSRDDHTIETCRAKFEQER